MVKIEFKTENACFTENLANYGEGNKMIKLVEEMDKSKLHDEIWVHELALYACNTSHLYRDLFSFCKKNLFKKYLKGNYDPMLARKMFYNHIQLILRAYEKEFCSKDFKIKLTAYDKQFLANEILEHYVCDFDLEKERMNSNEI